MLSYVEYASVPSFNTCYVCTMGVGSVPYKWPCLIIIHGAKNNACDPFTHYSKSLSSHRKSAVAAQLCYLSPLHTPTIPTEPLKLVWIDLVK